MKHCPQCGAEIEREAVGGHCAYCLLRIGLAVADGGLGDRPADLGPAREPAIPNGDREPALPKIRHLGDYELIEEIAHGGMGIVYKAWQVSLNRVVALKLIRAGELANEREVARFRAEAEAAANLDHPNIVPIYEVGEHEGRHYFSMKLIEGGALSERISDSGPRISNQAAARLVASLAHTVHYAHQHGLLHRDLKPGNILVDRDGQPHVTDFGLARRLEKDSAVTMSGAILGTPSYIAPEQAAGVKTLTTAADIYSLGAILYELLAGRPPFTGATVMETLQKVMNEEPVPPSVICSSRREEALTKSGNVDQSLLASAATDKVDRDLETICLKCLERDPVRRYGSAEALAEDLERWLHHEPIRARPAMPVERVFKWMRRKPVIATLVMTMILLVAAGLTGILWQWREAAWARARLWEELWQSHLTRAQAERQTLALGRRTRSLGAIHAAASMRPTRELRDEAAAALALTDLGETGTFLPHSLASGLPEWAMDPQLANVAFTAKNAVELRNVAGGGTVRLSHEEKNTRSMRFSPDGRSLAVKYFNRDFVVWDVATRKPRFIAGLLKNRGQEDSFYGFDFSADGRTVGCSDRGGLFHLYDAVIGNELRTLQMTNAVRPISMACFNPRFASVALAAGNCIEVWTLDGKRLAMRTNLLNAARIAWHPDGDTLAYVNWYEPEIVLWNTRSGKQRTLRSGQGSQAYLAFTPRGDLLATRGLDGVTRLWDPATEQVIVTTESGASLDFSADGTRLSFDRQGAGVGLWEVVRSPVFQTLRHSDAAPGVALQALFSDDGRRVIWRAADGVYGCDFQTRIIERGPLGWTYSLCGGESAGMLWGATPDGIVRWDDAWKPGARGAQVLRPGADWRWVSYVPQRRLLGIGSDTNVTVLALPEMSTVFVTNVIRSKAWAITSDGAWLAVATGASQDVHEDHVFVFDVLHQHQESCLQVNASSLMFDPSCRRLITGSADGCRFWELGTWREVRRFERQSSSGRVLPMAFTPDGRWFAYARTPAIIELAETETGRSLVSLEAAGRLQIRGLAFGRAGDTLAAAVENGVVQLWNLVALRRELARLGLDWRDDHPPANSSLLQP